MHETTEQATGQGGASGSEAGTGSEFRRAGNQIFDTVKGWIAAGNARQLVVRRHGQDVVTLPLTVVVVAAIIVPQLVGLGVIVALLTSCTLNIRRVA